MKIAVTLSLLLLHGLICAAEDNDSTIAFKSKIDYFLQNSPVGCEYFPCKNGGTCIALEGGDYTCKCANMYGGRNCDISLTTCTCKGATHCRTFDRANIDYAGKCRFLLSQYDGSKGISVYATRTPHPFNNDVMFIGGTDLSMVGYNVSVRLEELTIKVKVNGINVELPYRADGGDIVFDIFHITPAAIRFVTPEGFRMEFNRYWYVKVLVPKVYGRKMKGLCGNMDGDANNDLRLKDGTLIGEVENGGIQIGNSYVNDLQKTFEECQLEKAPKPVMCTVGTLFDGKITCEWLLRHTNYSYLFQNCLDVFDPIVLARFHDICIEDMGLTCDVQVARDIVRVFTTACNHNGLEMAQWTVMLKEECNCQGEKQTCVRQVSGCTDTCQSLTKPQPIFKPHGRCILENYNNVCACPEDTVLHNGTCIPPSACGCVDKDSGVVYPLKETWLTDDCSVQRNCIGNGKYDEKDFACPSDQICVAGKCQYCTPNKCKNGQCVEMGDESFCLCSPSFQGATCEQPIKKPVALPTKALTCTCIIGQECNTFDGAQLLYNGNCRYLLASYTDANPFTVHVTSTHRPHTFKLSYITQVELNFKKNVVQLQMRSFSSSAVVHASLNGLPIEVPYESLTNDISILHNGDAIEVRTGTGVVLSYNNKWRLQLTLDTKYTGKVTGVCGNYDSDQLNDYKLANGDSVLQKKDGASKVAESYVVSCPVGEEEEIEDDAEKDCPTPSSEKCQVMLDKKSLFKECISLMSPQKVGQYAMNCLRGIEKSCNDRFACEFLENFAKSCQEVGASVAPNWREAVSCPSGCPDDSMERAIGTTACRSTCSKSLCKVVPNHAVDICICPAGKVLFNGTCILNKDCGCVDVWGSPRQLKEMWLDESCSFKKTCLGNYDIKEDLFKCPAKTTCAGDTCSSCEKGACKNEGVCMDVSIEGEKMCKCKNGYSGSDCSVACNDKLDMVIVVDNTQSQCSGDPSFDGDTCDRWKKVLNYVSKVIKFLQIGFPDNNIALVKLSATPVLIGRGFVSSNGLIELLLKSNIAFNFDNANIASALRFMKRIVFSRSFDRPGAPNHVLFVLNSWNSLDNRVSEELAALKFLDAKFTAVVTNDKVNLESIKNLVSDSKSGSDRNYFVVPSVRAIESTKKHVQNVLNLCAAGKSVSCECAGDGRCVTFDQQQIEYKGFCRFLLLEHHSDVGDIKVWMKQLNPYPLSNLAYPRSLEVILNGQRILLERYIKSIGSLVDLWVDGIKRSVPFSGSDFYAYYNGDSVEVSTSIGVTVSLSKLYIAKVIVNPTFKYEVKGFCGNYDDSRNNDLRLKDGTAIKITKTITDKKAGFMIGDSYADFSDLDAINGQCSDQTTKKPCRVFPFRCKKLAYKDRRSPFRPCTLKYPKETKAFLTKCKEDFIDGCGKSYNTYCQNMAEFAQFCQSKGFYIDWRKKMICRKTCPPDMISSVRSVACIPTCSNPNAAKTCLLPDVTDSCVCPEGKVLNNQRCIKPPQCGCLDPFGMERKIGESWTSDNCTKKHTCDAARSITTVDYSCSLGSSCEEEVCIGCKSPLDIVFLVDESSSVCYYDPNKIHNKDGKVLGCDNWTYILQAMANILKNLKIGPKDTQVALIKFSTGASLVWNLDTYTNKATLLNAMRQLSYYGGFTNVAAALRIARLEVFNSPADRPYAQNLMIFLTDGIVTEEKEEFLFEAFRFQMMDLKQVAIGITKNIDEMSLRALSEPPHKLNSDYFMAIGFDEVEKLRGKLEEKLKICPDVNHYVCECWGDVHCKSFDGKYLDYPAICKTSLSISNALSYPFKISFGIHRSNNTNELSYINYVEILILGDIIEIQKIKSLWTGPLVMTLNGEEIELPFKNEHFSFEYSGEYLQFETKYGMKIGFSDRSNFLLDLPKILSYNVEGFCGNFDENPDNDILLKGQKAPSDTENPGIELGNSYISVDESLIPSCQATQPPVLNCEDSQEHLCTQIISHTGPFARCIHLLGELKSGIYFQQCINDYKRTCNRKGICRSIQDYARHCREHGWKEETPSEWRKTVKCSCSCEDQDMKCQPSGPSCLNTCSNQTASETCTAPPSYDVCVCKDSSKVMNKGRCVDVSECGCTDKTGKARRLGENFLENDCTLYSTCTKTNEIDSSMYVCPHDLQCFKNKCHPCKPVNPCMNEAECVVQLDVKFSCMCKKGYYGRLCERERKTAVCRLWPGVGISTYDQAVMEYEGPKKYLLSTGVYDRKNFFVFAKNYRACVDGTALVTRLKYLEFVYDGKRVRLEKDQSSLDGPILAVVDGKSVSIPYNSLTFSINYVGDDVQIQSFFGLIVALSTSSTALVQVPAIEAFSSNVKGVCGNNDENVENDYKTNLGVDVTGSDTLGSDIVNSYEDLVLFKEDDTSPFEEECGEWMILDLKRCRRRHEKCDKMKDAMGPFFECLQQIDSKVVDQFVLSCKKNFLRTCRIENTWVLEASVCESMKSFVWMCQSRTGWTDLNVAPEWREKLDCPCVNEDKDKVCKKEATSCPATCANPKAPETCNTPPAYYSAVCAIKNHVLFEGKCIDVKDCGCVDSEGRSRKVGEMWLTGDCKGAETCVAPKKIVKKSSQCAPTSQCIKGKCVGCGASIDIVFLVQNVMKDCLNDWKYVLQLMADVLKLMRIEKSKSAASVVFLSSNGETAFDLDEYKDTKDLIEAINVLECTKTVNKATKLDLISSLTQIRNDQKRLPDHVVIITESTSYKSDNLIEGEMNRLKIKGVSVVSIGVGDVKEEIVKALASFPSVKDKNYYVLNNYTEMDTLRASLQTQLQLCPDTPPARCSCHSGVHCSTFDKLNLSYQGTCKFLLVESSSVFQNFKVYMKNSNPVGNSKTVIEFIEVQFNGHNIKLKMKQTNKKSPVQAMVNGKIVGLPSTFPDFFFRLNGKYSELVTPFGLIVGLSSDWRSYVQIPRTYSYHTKGFCGNYDDDLMTDKMSAQQTMMLGKDFGKMIGDSYTGSFNSSCHKDAISPPSCELKDNWCKYIDQANGPFQGCFKTLGEQQVNEYKKVCEFYFGRICTKEAACDILEEYVETCRSTSVELTIDNMWRNIVKCPCSCLNPDTQTCRAKVPGCIDTCDNMEASSEVCKLPMAYDVCTCSQPEQVFFQGECIDKKMCGCKDDRDQSVHQIGSWWLNEGCLEKSKCEGDKVISREEFKCPPNTVCHKKACTACRPNPCLNSGKCKDVNENKYVCKCPPSHYGVNCELKYTEHTCVCQDGVLCRSFQGHNLNYATNKKWLLSSGMNNGKKFQIYAKSYKKYVDEDGVKQDAYLRYIQVIIADTKIHLEWDDLERNLFSSVSASVFKDKKIKRVHVPYSTLDFNFEWKGRFLKLTTQSGLSVSVSSRGLAIIALKADQSYDLTGFCGKKEDTFVPLSPNENGETIGDKFVVPDEEYELVYNQDRKKKPRREEKCDLEEKECTKVLKYPVFSDCLLRLNSESVDELMARCARTLKDECDSSVVCSFFEDLAIRCTEVVGVESVKEWRKETSCPCQTRDDLTCLSVGPSCINTCFDPSNVTRCEGNVILDSYACVKPGYAMSSEGACIAEETCGCINQKNESKVLEESWLSDDCSVSRKCQKSNNIVDSRHECGYNDKCIGGVCTGCDMPLDVAFLIDESDTICQNDPSAKIGAFSITTCDNFQYIQSFVINLVKYFDLSKVNVALLKFADQVSTVFSLDSGFDKEKIISLITKTSYNGGTINPVMALRIARKEIFKKKNSGNRFTAPNVIVMVMSKIPNVPDYRLNHELHEARIDGIKVIWVGVTTQVKEAVDFMGIVSKADMLFGQETHVIGKFEELSVVEKTLEDKLGMCGEKTATCACVGLENCYTFDNLPLRQDVECAFTLVKQIKEDNLLEVTLENTPSINRQILRVYYKDYLVELINNQVNENTIKISVKVNDKEIEIPFFVSNDLYLLYNGMTVQVDVKAEGLKAQMGALGYVAVTLPSRRQLDFSGFCGNYDGESDNDYKTKEGNPVRKNQVAGFLIANSYILETDTEADCFFRLENLETDDGGCEAEKKKCDSMPKLPAFKECEKLLGESLKGYHQESCNRAIILKCNEEVACEVIEDFITKCRQRGVSGEKLNGWRAISKCPCKCSDNDKECKEGKSSACLKTCPAIGKSVVNTCNLGEAWDVCRCKKNQMLFKGRCVQEDQCGCVSEEDGRSYEINTSWLNGNCTKKMSCLKDRSLKEEVHVCSHNRQCHERECHFCKPLSPCENGECIESETDYYCKCNHGFFGKNCEKKKNVAVCSCWLGTDCISFDGALWSNVNGLSRFLLASSTIVQCPFKVFVKNYRPCNEPLAVIRYVEIESSNELFRFEKFDPTDTTSKITAYVSGAPVALPFITEQFSILYEGDGIQFQSSCGLEVDFTGPSFNVKVPTYLSAKVTGMCGNFDDDLKNDLPPTQTSFNISDPHVHEPEEEYDYLYDDCPPDNFESCDKYNATCDKLKVEKVFSTCLRLLEEEIIEGFYKSCLATAKKACVTKLSKDEVLCQMQREFASACGYYLGFETDVTPLFHANDKCAHPKLQEDSKMENKKESKPCQNSCMDPTAEKTCLSTQTKVYNVRKCKNSAQLLFKGECVDADKCGCVDDNGRAREIGETWLDASCGTLNKCSGPNKVVTEEHNCTTSNTCSNSFCLGCDKDKDIVILLQSSATVCHNDPSINVEKGECLGWKKLLRIITNVVSSLDLSQSAVALVSYADEAKVEFNFKEINTHKALKKAIKGLRISKTNGANLNNALIEIEKMLPLNKDRSHISKHILIVSTSAYSGDEVDKAGVSMRLDRLKLIGTNLVSLGVVFNLPLPQNMVRALASAPNKKNTNYFYLESFSDQFKVRSGIEEILHICDTTPARCSCYGDVHCSTFDQLHLSYQGTCKFLLAEYPNSNFPEKTPESTGLPAFSVVLKNSNHLGSKTSTYVESVHIKVFGSNIVLRKEKFIAIGPVLAFVDSVKVAIPSSFEGFKLRYHGEETQLVTDFGLVVSMNRRWSTYVEVPRSYAFSTNGLCGNFDGNKENDRALADGTKYTKRDDMGMKIGDSFVVKKEDEKLPEDCFNQPKFENSCFLAPDNCNSMSQIENSIFVKCYKLFKEQKPQKAESYSKDCMSDLLAECKESSHCLGMNEYVKECRILAGGENVVPADWRIKMRCPCQCHDDDQSCADVTPACIDTCSQPEVSKTCEFPPVFDTCVCKNPKQVLFDGKCVDKEECGCYDDTDGTEHKVNSTWISKDCLQISECQTQNSITREPYSCPEGTSCYKNKCTACQPNPCLNGGECEDAENHRYKCKCPRKFSGHTCEKVLTEIACKCVRGTLCETFDGYDLLNNQVNKWTLFKAKNLKISDGVSPDSVSSPTGSVVFSEVEVRARNVEDCSSGEVWIQYLEVLIGGYVIRLERILGASVAPARVTVNEIEVSIPYQSPSRVYTNKTLTRNNNKNSNNNLPSFFEICFYGSYVSVKTQFGLKIEFNSQGIATIYTSIDAEKLSGPANIEGYCGNNDGILENDILKTGKSTEDEDYDWDKGNELATHYAVDVGDEIIGVCEKPFKGEKLKCKEVSPCELIKKTYGVYADCVWSLDVHVVDALYERCMKSWKENCQASDTCKLFEDLAAICSTKVTVASYKMWRQDTNCSCSTGLKELSCKDWGSPCQKDWLINPLMCIDTPTYDVVSCNSVSRLPGPCGPKDCIDVDGSAKLFGQKWLSENCKTIFKCTDQGIISSDNYQCPEQTKCSNGLCHGCDTGKDVLLVIDESSSICGDKPTCEAWVAILEMMQDVIKMVDISKNKTRIGLVKFSDEARVVFDLGQFFTKKSLIDSLMSLKSVGGVSNIGDALRVAREKIFEEAKCTGKRGLVPNLLVLITDGNKLGYDENYHVINHEIFNLRLLGVRVLVLGTTNDDKYLKMFPLISARPHKEDWDYFLLRDVTSLDKIERPFTNSISHCEFQTSTCNCVGNFHCTTFDHAYLSYTSQCPFLLTEIDLLGHPMSVVVTNELDIEGVLAKQLIEVKWKAKMFKLVNDYQNYRLITRVFVEEVNVEIPYQRPNISIQYSGMKAELVLGYEDKSALVGMGPQGHVYVTIPYKLQMSVKGFCGNYDNNDANDYITSQNEDVISSSDPGSLIGFSYSKANPTDKCETVSETAHCEKGVEKCKQIRGDSAINKFYLNECNEKLPKKTVDFFYNACLKSYGEKCMEEVACKVISTYVDECQLAGVNERALSGWKQIFNCPCKCDINEMVCVANAKSCVKTCPNPSPITYSLLQTTQESRNSNETCKLPDTQDVCECSKAGLMLFKGRCVQEKLCGCVSEEDGRSYELNASWLSSECTYSYLCLPTHKISKVPHKCPLGMQCNEGVCSVCYPKSPCDNYGTCKEMGKGDYKCICRDSFYGKNCEIKTQSCRLYGNGYANTFDWAALQFKSTCKFLLTSSVTETNMKYQVYARYEKKDNFYSILYLEIVYAGHVVRLLRREVDGVDLLVATINGVQVSNLPVKEKYFTLNYSNRKIVYQANFGLVVSLTRTWIAEVSLTTKAKNVIGYCGSPDGNQDNDYVTKVNKPVKDDKDPGGQIGLSYVVEDDLEKESTEQCEAEPPKETTVKTKEATKVCSIIGESDCAQRLDSFKVKPFEEACVRDFENGCGVSGDQVYCQNIEAFAELCEGIGYSLKTWMKDSGCACKCLSADQQCISSQSSSRCVPTCGQPNAQDTCTAPDAFDVCACGPSQVLHDGKCISEMMCACVDDKGLDRKIGETWHNNECTKKFTCSGPGSVSQESVTSCEETCKV